MPDAGYPALIWQCRISSQILNILFLNIREFEKFDLHQFLVKEKDSEQDFSPPFIPVQQPTQTEKYLTI